MGANGELLLRTLLFVPGNESEKLAKVGRFPSDAIVIDLEDAVPPDQKAIARDRTHERVLSFRGRQSLWVRINGLSSDALSEDVSAAVHPHVVGLVIPKVETADELYLASEAITNAERVARMPVGTTRMMAVLETPRGISHSELILENAPEGLETALFGSGDFSTALGIDLTAEAEELLYARSRIVVAARAANLAPPVDGPWLWLDDITGLEVDSLRSRRLGFQGRAVLHPRQVEPVLRAYSDLSDEERARAEAIVVAFEAAASRGVGAVSSGGQFIDYPIYRNARERLRRARTLQGRSDTSCESLK